MAVGGWGERKDRGTGSTGQIEAAHTALDRLDIPGGSLAERVLITATALAAARHVLVWADGVCVVHSGRALADWPVETAPSQAVLRDAGCWERGAIAERDRAAGVVEHSLNHDFTACSCGWTGDKPGSQTHMAEVIKGAA